MEKAAVHPKVENMTYRKLSPMMYTKELKSTIEFYTSVLDFNCNGQDLSNGWASLEKDSIQLMVAFPNDHFPFSQPQFTGSFYFHVDDATSIWNQVKDRANICYPIEDFDYGMREFAIYDNNGYMLQFGESL